MKENHLIPIRPAAMDAWRALQDVLDDCYSVPCNGRTEWISESAEDRAYAAGHCRGCPALTACGKYADAARERDRVWGGRDRNVREQQSIETLPLFEDLADVVTMRPVTGTSQGDNHMPRRNIPKARKRKDKPTDRTPRQPEKLSPEQLARSLVERGLSGHGVLEVLANLDR